MDQQDLIRYWVETSNEDFSTMIHLYDSKDYSWCLFIGHLVIEKLLKAMYVKNIGANVPKTHDLLRLADKALVETSNDQKDDLDLVTTFNISARYPDYKQSFKNKCTYEFTTNTINKIKELRKWLMKLIES
jgi:HEPN domain-containing protein